MPPVLYIKGLKHAVGVWVVFKRHHLPVKTRLNNSMATIQAVFPSKPCKVTKEATYHNFFLLDGRAVGPTKYVKFLYPNTDLLYVGKIWSVFQDHENDNQATAEIQLFPYATKNEENQQFNECLGSSETMEIPISNIVQEITMIHVPPTVAHKDAEAYVSEHMFDEEYEDDMDTENAFARHEEEDITDVGFYQFDADSPNENGGFQYALPPQLTDLYFSWSSEVPVPFYQHDFFGVLQEQYLVPVMHNLVPSANAEYVFAALNHSSYKAELQEGSSDTYTIVFRRTEHTVSQRQLDAICDLQGIVMEIRRHSEEDELSDAGWLRGLYGNLEGLKALTTSFLL